MESKNGPLAPPESAETTDAILRFMESIGHRSEAEFYLALFRAESKESFANLVIGASVLRDGTDAVVLDLRFLCQSDRPLGEALEDEVIKSAALGELDRRLDAIARETGARSDPNDTRTPAGHGGNNL